MIRIEDVKADELNSSNVLYDFMFVTDADKIAHNTEPVLPGVSIHDETQGTYTIAHWLMDLVHWFL